MPASINNPGLTPSSSTSTTPAKTSLHSAPRILKNSIDFYLLHWKALLPIALIPLIPNILNTFLGQNPLTVIVGLLGFVISFVAPLALLYVVTRNGEAKTGESYSQGLKALIPIGWIALLSSLASMGGFLLFIIPGLIIGLWVSLANFAFFSENLKGTRALVRSWQLIRGYSFSVFWRYLFLGIVSSLIGLISIFVSLSPFFVNGTFSVEQLNPQNLSESSASTATSFSLMLFSGLIMTPINAIYSYLIYSNLRKIKPQPLEPEEEKRIRKKILIFTWLGVLSIILVLVIIFSGLFQVISKYTGPNPTSTPPFFDISKFPDFSPSPNPGTPSLQPLDISQFS